MLKYKIISSILLVGLFCLQSINADYESEGSRMIVGVFVYKDESECIREGGLCVKTTDCIEELGTKGLCPINQKHGVECCQRLKIKAAPCSEHLGACMDRCNPSIQRPSTDCPKDQVCCVLV